MNKEKLWNIELKKRKEKLKKYENKIIQKDWFNTILNSIEFSKKKEDNFKIIHELIKFYNNYSLDKHKKYIYLLKYIHEINFDLKSSEILVLSGCYKQAISNLRFALENSFRIIYFKQYPNDLMNLNEKNYYSLSNRNTNLVIFKDKTLNKKIIDMKNELSNFVHTSPKNLNSNILTFSFKKEKFREWDKYSNKVNKLILKMLKLG